GDYAVLHRPDGDDVARSAAEHLLRFLADREHLLPAAVLLLHGDHAGLVGDDAHAPDVDERVRGAEIDGEVAGEELVNAGEHELRTPFRAPGKVAADASIRPQRAQRTRESAVRGERMPVRPPRRGPGRRPAPGA